MEGATDVTRRYVRNASGHGAERSKCPEEVLMYIINEIRKLRRENMLKEERKRLIIEDEREEKELRGYVIRSLATELGRSLPGASPEPSGGAGAIAVRDGVKAPAERNGTQAWREAMGEQGRNGGRPDRGPREGH